MNAEELKQRNFDSEFIYSASRSGGPGGQNVNKVNTRVELRFSLVSTSVFSDQEKELIFRRLKNKINKEGEIILVSQAERSQLLNKQAVTDKFFDIVAKALTVPAPRRATKPTIASGKKRLEVKKTRGLIKRMRKDKGDQ